MQLLTRFQNTRLSGLVLLLVMAGLCCGAAVQAMEQNTVFLPLKINSPDPQRLTAAADTALEEALAEQGYQAISRSEAARVVDYRKSWPPGAAVLRSLAKTTDADYVAVGSLTQLGASYSLDYAVFDLLQPGAPYTSFRESDSLEDLRRLLSEAVGEAMSYANRSFTVASIAPAGNERIDAGAILRKISTEPGDLYDPAGLRRDLKAVFGMGYFDNVEIEATDSDTGKKILFRVEEKPLIGQVVISGTDHIKEKDVRDAANIPVNTILNPAKVNDAVARVRELYKSKGYYNTQVAATINYPNPESAEVRLVIEEGDKITIEEITFQGNTAFEDDELAEIIQTGTYSWWLSWLTEAGVLKMDILNQDAARIGAYYQNHGFIEAKVGSPQVEQKEDSLFITFPIEEGPRYRVGMVEVEGDLIEDKEQLISRLQIRQEPFLNRQVLREDTTRLTDLYAEHGYAFARVFPKIDKTDQGKRVNILFKVSKGSLVYFNRVEIQGNTRTRDNVIRRDLQVKEGGVFDSKAIRTSTQKLQRLGFFEEVTVTPKPTLNEDQMDVLVDIKEKSTGQFSIGAGYSSSENVLVMGEITEDNFLGTGNRLALTANLSSKTARYNLNFTNPRIFDSKVSAGFDVFNWEKKYDDYTKDSTGAGVRFGHPFFERWYSYYGYTIADTHLTDIKDGASQVIIRSKDINLTSSVRFSLVRDTRNRGFSPSNGSRNSVSVKYAGGPLGGDAQFTKVEGSSSWWFPMVWETIFHAKAAAGQAFANEEDKLPVYEHFYLGGMNSIRGFESLSISPVDPVTGEKIGGDKMWYGTLSVIFPLLTDMGMQGEVFTDFGNVYGVEDNWDFSEIKKTAGVGILWLSPLGPLRLAWGFNLDRQEGEDSSNWDFSMGGTF
ncbi:outer membrane protein assembly factor BamA [Desulfogranum mediterraneum]|uniref:outer membrane protein assembly factor BamA n=1 Tax=Desulfogranum mediterraneum TaxID=160661 RepID=UPI0003FE6D30|nr:outer membrane protein assembly factor BamA [Desulfogranum mediterraneum]